MFATARNPDSSPELQEVAASAPSGRVYIVQLDTTDAESIRVAGKKVEELLNGDGLDYLINNAAKVGNLSSRLLRLRLISNMFREAPISLPLSSQITLWNL